MSGVFRIVVYMTGFGGIGYVLMKLIEPNEDKLKKIRESSGTVYGDEAKRKQLIVQRIREAAESGAGTKFSVDPSPPAKP